jgi:hypothetical protein
MREGMGEQFDTRKWEGIGEIFTQCQNRSFKMGHVDIYPKYHFSPPNPPISPPQIPQIRPFRPGNRTLRVRNALINPLFPLTHPPRQQCHCHLHPSAFIPNPQMRPSKSINSSPIPPILPPQIPQIRPPEPQNRTPTFQIPIFNPLFPLTRPPPASSACAISIHQHSSP